VRVAGRKQNTSLPTEKVQPANGLHFVKQYHDSGCFIACVAMLLGKSYSEVFKKIHPGMETWMIDPWGYPEMDVPFAALTVADAVAKLPSLGIQAHLAPTRNLRRIKRGNKNALIVIRWEDDITSEHGIVFDAARKKFMNPSHGDWWDIKSKKRRLYYQRQVDKIYYIE